MITLLRCDIHCLLPQLHKSTKSHSLSLSGKAIPDNLQRRPLLLLASLLHLFCTHLSSRGLEVSPPLCQPRGGSFDSQHPLAMERKGDRDGIGAEVFGRKSRQNSTFWLRKNFQDFGLSLQFRHVSVTSWKRVREICERN